MSQVLLITSSPRGGASHSTQVARRLAHQLIAELFAADVVVIASSKAVNFQDTYLRHVLGFIGITDIETIHIEGVAHGPEATEKALTSANGRVAAVRPHALSAAASA